MRHWGKSFILLLAALLTLALSGCMFSASAEDLYALPALPAEYEALSAKLSEILSAGAEYASPQSGSNLPPVQMIDLDGDGSDEVLAFFRVSSEEQPLRIYIFRALEGTYEQAAVIDGSGTSIQSILYEDMDGDGSLEIVVSWSGGAALQALAVYALEGLEPIRLMSTPFARYEIADLDGDGAEELVVIRSDEGETAVALADYYDWNRDRGDLSLQSTARLSVSVAALQWTQMGTLQEGETAVFVTGREAGVDETSRAVTDILVYRQPDLVNIALSSETGVSSQIYRFLNLQPTDINGDRATEVPRPAALPQDPDDQYFKIYWYSYDASGGDELQAITYHNQSDGWYFLIPEEWDGHFTVRQANTSSSVHTTTFYSLRDSALGDELFTIYTLTGTNRAAQAATEGRAILRVRADTIYAISFSEAYQSWRFAQPRDSVASRFMVIARQWSTENS